MAGMQVPFNIQGYLNEFSRSLTSEVRSLLSEVGKLREDKRNLELCVMYPRRRDMCCADYTLFLRSQIGELLTFKAKYGPEGQFDPSW